MSNENMTPLVSVIMPVFNRERQIGAAIKSVLSQTFVDFELIVVDDASEDGTRAVVEAFAKNDSRVKIVANRRNSRRSKIAWEPRNDGLQLANGEFVAYLDSDNTWDKSFLSEMLAAFDGLPSLQLAYCNSRNHYASRDQFSHVIDNDLRRLLESDDIGLTAAFLSSPVQGRPGLDWYIDTNEIMHRTTVFRDLGRLWNVLHPNRMEINSSQTLPRPYRRHNDQELVEAIIARYGFDSVMHVNRILVDYYYSHDDVDLSSRPRNSQPSRLNVRINELVGDNFLSVDRFFGDHLVNKDPVAGLFDLAVGELDITEVVPWHQLLCEFVDASEASVGTLTKYGGTAGLSGALGRMALTYKSTGLLLDEYGIAPCDGGHNALFHSIAVLSGRVGVASSRSVTFMVPAYPYWSICTAAGARPLPLEAYGHDEFIDKLDRVSRTTDIGAIVVNSPNNPFNEELSLRQVEQLNVIAQRTDAGIIVDIPYWTFGRQSHTLGSFDRSRTVWCDSVSKSLGLPGLRLGFALSSSPRLASLLRAHKSATSLLPSAFKTAFVDFALRSRPTLMMDVAATVQQRRLMAETAFKTISLPSSVTRITEGCDGLYDVFRIKGHDKHHNSTERSIMEELRASRLIKCQPGFNMFPPDFIRSDSGNIIRLSYGKVRSIRTAVAAFASQFC